MICRDGPPARKSTLPTLSPICSSAIRLQILDQSSSDAERDEVASGATMQAFEPPRLRLPLACVTASEVAALK